MATLKDHQRAMVDLLASGSGIPASASRLAHAMLDVLAALTSDVAVMAWEELCERRLDATTPGLNDKALAGDIEACRHKATPAERRVKELENTIRQLKVRNAELKDSRDAYKAQAENFRAKLLPEQAGCRKPDTQVCEHQWAALTRADQLECLNCGAIKQ